MTFVIQNRLKQDKALKSDFNHIVLAGDSIFDNASYVEKGESVSDFLSNIVGEDVSVTLLAVDGDVTTDVSAQLSNFPDTATHVFVSCGGNDALREASVLRKQASTVGDALEQLVIIRENFRKNYQKMLDELLNKSSNLTVCTVYNSVPDTTPQALGALALFNEVILQEATAKNLPVIDLRNVCQDIADYSEISPIEPSGKGSLKIARVISFIVNNHSYDSTNSIVYT